MIQPAATNPASDDSARRVASAYAHQAPASHNAPAARAMAIPRAPMAGLESVWAMRSDMLVVSLRRRGHRHACTAPPRLAVRCRSGQALPRGDAAQWVDVPGVSGPEAPADRRSE